MAEKPKASEDKLKGLEDKLRKVIAEKKKPIEKKPEEELIDDEDFEEPLFFDNQPNHPMMFRGRALTQGFNASSPSVPLEDDLPEINVPEDKSKNPYASAGRAGNYTGKTEDYSAASNTYSTNNPRLEPMQNTPQGFSEQGRVDMMTFNNQPQIQNDNGNDTWRDMQRRNNETHSEPGRKKDSF